ncbi:MAG TPA: amidophosphoribosyltransferase, partial [Clostridiales bacterium]|nr:amidophosphoribosyltransferase [Clostridiales bacterium]
RVVLVDDSIVRGTPSRYIVSLLRQAGAREVHMRISSPPYRHPCFYGIDTSSSGELVARERDVEQIRAYIRADSLCYLAPEDLERAVYPEGRARRGFCTACFTGDYPVPVPGAENVKFALEACGEPATGGRS